MGKVKTRVLASVTALIVALAGFCFGTAAKGKSMPVVSAAAGASDIFVRTDSLAASGSGGAAKVQAQTGAVLFSDRALANSGQENLAATMVLKLGTDASVTFEFDLPNDCAGGTIRFFGRNIGAAKVGIYIPGHAENDGFYELTLINKGDASYVICDYGFGNSSWYDAAEKIIRVRVWGATDASPALIYNAAVIPVGQDYAFDGEADFGPLTQGGTKYMFYSGGGAGSDIYYDNGVTPTVLLGLAIYELRLPVNQTLFTLNFSSLGGVIWIGIKNSAALSGDLAAYTRVSTGIPSDLSAYTVTDPDNAPGSGDEYICVQIVAAAGPDAGGQVFFKSISAKGEVPEQTEGFTPSENKNVNIPENDRYVYFKAGDANEKNYFYSPTSAASVEEGFNESHSGLVTDMDLGGNIATKNARKLAANETLTYEFDLADGVMAARLKLFAKMGSFKVSAHVDKSEKRYTVIPSSGLGAGMRGAVIYELDGTNALKASDNKFRIQITAERETTLFSLLIETGATEALTSGVHITNLSENALKYLHNTASPNLYYLDSSIPTWFIGGSSNVVFRFNLGSAVEKVNLTAAVTGSVTVSTSYDDATYTTAFTFNSGAAGAISESRMAEIANGANKTLYVKLTAAGDSFVHSVSLGMPSVRDDKAEFTVFGDGEADYLYSMPVNPANTGSGLTGVCSKVIFENGRRIAYNDTLSSELIYKVDFDAAKIFTEGGQNKLYVSLKVAYGSYNITVSSKSDFAAGSSVSLKGSFSSNSNPMVDASAIFTAAGAVNGVKTVYIKITHDAGGADTSYPTQELVITGMGVYADGTKGVVWPNDNEFDYDLDADYENHPGLPALPVTPDTTTGTETYEEQGEGGCKSSAAAVSVFSLLAVMYAVLKKGGKA